jgi:hypothetical protein
MPQAKPLNRPQISMATERVKNERSFVRFRIHVARVLMLCAVLLTVHADADAQTPRLPSWNDGSAKQAIISFVRKVTDKSGTNYAEPQDRIATFDQDGTLWVEHPLYRQAAFALDRVRALAPKHPEWNQREPFKTVISGDREAMAKFSEGDW